MKMICELHKTCELASHCCDAKPHREDESCGNKCRIAPLARCVPVAQPAKKLTAWVVWFWWVGKSATETAGVEAYHRRSTAREEAQTARQRGYKTRGPVKVEVEL